MAGSGAPELSISQTDVKRCAQLRVAVVAAQWHTEVMDALVANAVKALAETRHRRAHRGARARLLRAAGGRARPGPPALRRDRRARRRHPRRHPALRLRLPGRHRRADHGLGRPPASRSASACSTCDTSSRRSTAPGCPARPRTRAARRPCAAVATALTIKCLGSVERPKTFEGLFEELAGQGRRPGTEGSRTVELVDAGVHAIGKKIVEEAAEVWMAAEHEGDERAAEEISQLLYHLQVLMVARGSRSTTSTAL